jgi:hypothetical protein
VPIEKMYGRAKSEKARLWEGATDVCICEVMRLIRCGSVVQVEGQHDDNLITSIVEQTVTEGIM